MKKRILALIISLVLSCPCAFSAAGEDTSYVSAVEGSVAISYTTDAPEGTPVVIFILPQIKEKDEDVTVTKLSQAVSKSALTALNLEYVTAVTSGEGGLVSLECKMKDTLTTGVCHVIFNYLGSDEYFSAGTFEHVGKADVKNLVDSLNKSDAQNCGSIIDKDINGEFEEDGETRKTPKEILRKSSADVAYYTSLEDKTDFHSILYLLKGSEDFTLTTLVDKFNKTVVWCRLCTDADTLGVLNAYNGEGEGKYWNLPLDKDSDFSSLPETERIEILDDIKSAKYSDKELLFKGFEEAVVLAAFRNIETREDLEELIKDGGKYSSYFDGVRKIIDGADLSTYKTSELFNNVLDGNSECESVDEIETLFTNSIPEETTSGGGGSGGGSGSGMGATGINIKNNSEPADDTVQDDKNNTSEFSKMPFEDVDANHWAKEYISKLYSDGAINGVSEKSFNPGGLVQRQDFVKILVGALGIDASGSKTEFSDVVSGSYYEAYVAAAYKKGFISGISAESFGVGISIKREDAAVIMARVLESFGVKVEGTGTEFKDSADASDYAKDAIKIVSAAKIFGGDENGNFNPKSSLTRAEACAILCRLADSVKEV